MSNEMDLKGLERGWSRHLPGWTERSHSEL